MQYICIAQKSKLLRTPPQLRRQETTQDSYHINTWDRSYTDFSKLVSENKWILNAQRNQRPWWPHSHTNSITHELQWEEKSVPKSLWEPEKEASSGLYQHQRRKFPESEDTGERGGDPTTGQASRASRTHTGVLRGSAVGRRGENLRRRALEIPQWWEKREKETFNIDRQKGIGKEGRQSPTPMTSKAKMYETRTRKNI